jgi:PIN domain nuclease of toxin-antitoxin system
MIDKHIIDTHSLIWYVEGNPKLGKDAKAVFDDKNVGLVLPVIALAEAFDVVQKQRTSIPDVTTLFNRISGDPRFEIESLTADILLEAQNALNVPEMHDRLITATALKLEKQGFKVAVLTKDPDIIASKLVEIIW